jgi:hypothetical protein
MKQFHDMIDLDGLLFHEIILLFHEIIIFHEIAVRPAGPIVKRFLIIDLAWAHHDMANGQ